MAEHKTSLFAYNFGNSFLRRCPAWVKLIFIPVINIALLLIPEFYFVIVPFFIVVLFCIELSAKIKLNEQLTDIKPVLYYAILLFLFDLLTVNYFELENIKSELLKTFSWENQKETVFFLLKLIAIMQTSSLFFRTSTSLEIRNAISKIETKLRRNNKKNSFTQVIFLFLNFIPMVSKTLNQLKLSWKARSGKPGIKMYVTLLPVLFSVSIKKAWNMSRALSIRN